MNCIICNDQATTIRTELVTKQELPVPVCGRCEKKARRNSRYGLMIQ